MRRLIRDISSVLIIAGALMLIDAGVTLVWQEPVTAVIALINRASANDRYLQLKAIPFTPEQRAALMSSTMDERIAYIARRDAVSAPAGAAIGRIVIGKISASFDVYQGTDTASLELGPGHYPTTAFPGLGETVAIAGHRTTYLAPFRNINELSRGDRIELQMPYATFTYDVQYDKIVTPNSWWITHNVGYERLVLSACNPLYSAAQRIVVFARLARVQPNLAALSDV